jgi:carboxyl-terminal processing protease
VKLNQNPTSICKPAGLIFILMLLSGAACADAQTFTFSAASKKLTGSILEELADNHYRKVTLDDKFSQALFNHYLKTLDPAKTIFLQADIQEFGRYTHQLDDALKSGKLDPAQLIFRRFHERTLALVKYTLADIERYNKPYAGKNNEIELDRKDAPWPANLAESQVLWDKPIFNEVLLIKLSDDKKNNKDSLSDRLRKRYENRLKKLETMTADDAFEIFINASLDLYDPHTEWLTPKSEENFKINMSLSLEGIGAVLQQEEDKTKIARLVTGGPAAKSGALKTGDFILAVAQGKNGEMEDISGQRLDEVVQKIRGPKGSIVRLQIETENSQSIKVVEIVRDKVKLEDQAAKSDIFHHGDKKIGIINIPTFYMDFEAYQRGDANYRSTTRDVEKLLRDLIKENVDGVVVDLRSNGGGSLQEARLLTNLFISQGPVVQIRSANNLIDRSLRAEQNPVYLGPLLVLTNHLSASASEIFAGAIQDYERGLVLGEQTFGKGTVQTIVNLDYGQLKFTNAKFYRVSGDSTQHRGVVPDITTPSLFDYDDVGESSLDHVLPWDRIHEIAHTHYNEIKPFVERLSSLHKKRMDLNPDYQLLLEKISYRNSKKSLKSLSLDEKVRRQQRDADNDWLLRVTNQMRKSKKLSEFSDIDALEKYEEEKSAQWSGATVIDLEDDFLLREGAMILCDFIDFKIKENGSSLAIRK